MENIGGGLAFKATLDIDDFNVSAQAMERHIKDFSNTAAQEAAEVEDSFQQMAQRAGQYITYYLVGQGMNNLVSSIVSVRGQFQQLEIAFGTMLGSEEKATALMQQMVNTAAKTPFDLMGVAEGAKQLLAYGVSAEKVNDTLVRLGNIASGLSIPLNDIVYLYGTTMVQGRLYAQDVRQFTGRGIPLVKELAEKYHTTAEGINEMVSAGKIGFPDVEEVLNKMTNAGGQFYQLMEKQSSSLTGQIANLQDAWDSALNSLGEKSEGALSAGIQSATYLVEHMDDVVRILKSVAIAYGSVKAATVLASVATKGYTGIAVLDNAARTAKLALMKTEAVLSGEVVSQKKAMEAAEMANYAALQTTLTAEEQAAVVKQMRIAAIQSLLTAQQQEYLANLNLTASSSGYEAAAIGVMTAEQRLALSKQDLTAKSATYRAAIMQEAQAKMANQAQTVEAMRTTVREAARTVEAAKAKAIAATQATEAARYEVYWAQQSGNATAIASAQKKLEAAVDTQAAARKAALSAQTDFYTKKKQLETAATLQAKTASIADTGAKTAQTAATNILSVATNKLSAGFKALWAAMAANPIGAIISAIGIVMSLFTLFKGKTEEETDAMKEFEDGTKKVTDKLDLYYTILQQSEPGSKTHKEMLEKVNEVCKEYNSTLLDENDTLQEQEKKYLKVKAAVQATTAEKIKAKRVEEEMNTLNDNSDSNYDSFDTRMNNLQYGTGEKRKITNQGHGETYEVEITKAAENIQNMAPEIREAVRSLVEAGAKELATLSGDDFTKKYNEIVNNVVAGTKSGTHATDKEMEAFSSQLKEYLDNEVRDVRTFNDAINLVNQNLNNFLAPKDTTNVDITKMSMEELHELANKLNGKEVTIDCKTYGFENALSLLKAVNDEINKQQNNLNTENGISAEIQNLKKLRGEAQLGSKAWNDYNNQITKLQTRLDNATGKGKKGNGGGHKGTNDAKRNADSLRQKQLDADKRLEEARIAVMEEGYEKRKAQLDLQHKEALRQIKKEEDELIEARKKAGKGGLTVSEKANFQERRNLENTSYAQSQNKLFEGELDYKKKQYQLYFRWVQNMGKEVADKQFEKLLTDGNSYKQYVENEIAKLEEKRNGGTKLTEGEGNYLISLTTQRDELNGEKSALEKFKQQVSESISQCQTLAEKIEAVAVAKAKLENGESGIVSTDERAEASLVLSQQDADLQKELQKTVLDDYRTFEEQRQSITTQYALLRTQAEKMGDAERLAQINKAEQEALSALNMSFLQQSESWKNLFTDIDTLTVAQIQKLISDIQKQLNAGNLKLSPVDYKAVIDNLNQAKNRIQELNPFKALGTFFNDYLAAKKKLRKAEADLASGKGTKKSVDEAKKDVKSAAQGITNSIQKVTSISTDCATSLQSMFDALGMDGVADGLGTAIDLMGQLGNAAASVGKFMSGDILGGITGMVSSITSVVGIFAKLHDKKYEKRIQNLQKQIDNLQTAYSRLERAFNNTYWVFNDEQRQGYEKNIQAIKDQIAALEKQREVAKKSWDFTQYAKLTTQIKQLNAQLNKAKEGGDMLALWQSQKESLREQQELMRQQIQAEKSKKKTDNNKIKEWENQIEEINQQIEDLDQQMMETFAGTDVKSAIDEFADAIVDAYCSGEDAAKALGETTKKVLKNAVVEALKRNFLAKGINDAVEYLGKAMEDGVLSDEEKKEFERQANAAGEKFKAGLEAVGDWIKDVDETASDPLTGAVTSMSEETGGVIAGRLNAFIINQGEQTSVMREQLLQQSEIARNTALSAERLQNIENTLRRIETKDNSLLSQGIS
uniref:Tape measure domain protein n=1 Tax=Siphoviridae sp. ctCS019 TaxID=2825378 RepID=A0A8S5U5B5_9CAUD|nr:MAG TPA: Tape measure domain protein [Siphoviridae sp. ctCS019]